MKKKFEIGTPKIKIRNIIVMENVKEDKERYNEE